MCMICSMRRNGCSTVCSPWRWNCTRMSKFSDQGVKNVKVGWKTWYQTINLHLYLYTVTKCGQTYSQTDAGVSDRITPASKFVRSKLCSIVYNVFLEVKGWCCAKATVWMARRRWRSPALMCLDEHNIWLVYSYIRVRHTSPTWPAISGAILQSPKTVAASWRSSHCHNTKPSWPRGIEPMFVWCWASVADGGPTSKPTLVPCVVFCRETLDNNHLI